MSKSVSHEMICFRFKFKGIYCYKTYNAQTFRSVPFSGQCKESDIPDMTTIAMAVFWTIVRILGKEAKQQ